MIFWVDINYFTPGGHGSLWSVIKVCQCGHTGESSLIQGCLKTDFYTGFFLSLNDSWNNSEQKSSRLPHNLSPLWKLITGLVFIIIKLLLMNCRQS